MSDNSMNELLKELGVDTDLHDKLIESQNIQFEKTIASAPRRPDAMKHFDYTFHASHAERVREIYNYRSGGKKSIGTFCIYVPDEIALAADVLPIPLCGGSGWSLSYADKMLPRDICPLIRSTFGMAFSATCPYKKLKDFAVGETTCDAKKKAWDLFGFKVLEVPQKKNEHDQELWIREVFNFKDMCENLSGKKITMENLAESIALVNRKRELLKKINEYRKLPEPPINGTDALLLSQTALSEDVRRFNDNMERLIEELEERVQKGISAYSRPGKRVIIAGTPSPMGFAKIHHLVEKAGLRIVHDESCTGARYYKDNIEPKNGTLENMIRAVAERYFKIDCACFSPNTERMQNISEVVKEFKADGVINFVLQYCHGFNVESKMVENMLRKMNIPSIKIETDYSEEDSEQIFTRIEAFSEVLTGLSESAGR